ncbi:hypothetical protein EV715DRAFT_210530 [Schizophyllum commune]
MSSPVRLSATERLRKARHGTLRRRDTTTGLAIVGKAQSAARDSQRAQKKRTRLPQTPSRQSARLIKKLAKSPPAKKPSSTDSTESFESNIDRASDVDYTATPERGQGSRNQKQGSSYHTPEGKLFKIIGRPRPNQLAVTFVSEDGTLRCAGTGQSNQNGTVQFCHIADRSISSAEKRQLEIVMGHEPDGLNLDTRLNLIPLCVEIHIPMDLGKVILLPTAPWLSKLRTALASKKIDDWKKRRAPRANSEHYLFHEDVFSPDTVVDVRIVPLLKQWSNESGIQYITRNKKGKIVRQLFEPPFTTKKGEPVIPLMRVRCSPFFLAFKANWALTKPNAGKEPKYVKSEVRELKRIGKLMRREIDDLKKQMPADNDANQQMSVDNDGAAFFSSS